MNIEKIIQKYQERLDNEPCYCARQRISVFLHDLRNILQVRSLRMELKQFQQLKE